ncbi:MULTISPECIES: peptidoglycan-binding domain-containing protein [Rhizobium]|uniref:Peptidoglycan-binding protein (Cell wall degradation activity) n=2 Tax=Rhizobium rhizogenes TaxID=359 RepID=B9JBJ9_RHIR8|nr:MULTISPECIES: peptidoglycan-binding domain-containing protein [Rhizobium]ACM25905.1 peptidoglycan-binding protein (cell wall degradation activity) [Rhizobium rhizogenes K84]KAA6491255.1 peptidoglycan-binding protein [Agrobacterium sp. ICMP 7243]OCJ25022.1 peptidoglycan-binding protein [Agrobacterium sp. B131/95]EJK84922.1 putative peptidoglycan binding protein [Rhizobium sp. AP16]MDJ1632944.1 peptidoglycan-binding domain-containing protein [Rhizobium rhizogenes]
MAPQKRKSPKGRGKGRRKQPGLASRGAVAVGSLGLRGAGALGGLGVRGAGALAGLLGGAVGRHPAAAGGIALFFAVFGFVTANALWYQVGIHPSPLLRTREPGAPYQIPGRKAFLLGQQADTGNVTTFRIERQDSEASNDAASNQPTVTSTASVQTASPATRMASKPTVAAVPAERPINVSANASAIDPVAAAIQSAEKGLGKSPATPKSAPSDAVNTVNMVMQIQKGLSNIAYSNVSVDGVAGEQTKAAIRRFQKHYRLPETGEPDMAVLKKLQDIGAL